MNPPVVAPSGTTSAARLDETKPQVGERPLVLHVRTVTGTGGGPDKTILNSPRFLERHGYRCLCAFLHPPGDPGFEEIRRRGQDAGATVVSVPDRGAFDIKSIVALVRLCRRHRVAIWHGHDYKSNVLGLLVRKFQRMRLVTTVHGWVRFTKRTPLYYAVDRWAVRRYERVVCVSDDLRERCIESGKRSDLALVIENAIDTETTRRSVSTDDAKRQLGFRPESFLVGGIGRLSPEKGFDVLVEAVGRVIATGIDAELVIAGEGEDRLRLERLIAEQPEPHRFRLLGHRSDVGELFQAFDVFALSSYREGLPNVILEAMAFETPIVATAVAGVPRLVEDGRTGLLVPPGDAVTLAAALGRLAASPALGRELARAARTLVETNYSFSRRMEKMTDVYRSLGVKGAEV